jgi:hypothetical protein
MSVKKKTLFVFWIDHADSGLLRIDLYPNVIESFDIEYYGTWTVYTKIWVSIEM